MDKMALDDQTVLKIVSVVICNNHIIELCSRITHSRAPKEELYVERFQNLIYMH